MPEFAGIQVPEITPADFFAFHEAHFSQKAVAHFQSTFLEGEKKEASPSGVSPDTAQATAGANDEHATEERPNAEGEALDVANDPQPNPDEGAAPADTLKQTAAKKKTKKRKRNNGNKNNKNNKNNTNRPSDKPDLRKRTWDVVGDGLESLDYDGTTSSSTPGPAPFQRRRVKYEED